MKYLTLMLCLALTATIVNAQNKLKVTVTNVKNDQGVVRLALFKGDKGFPNEEKSAFKTATVDISKGKAIYSFENLPEGKYSVSSFHDSQNTGKLRTNPLGLPRDQYGFSNNAMGTFGPPSYKDAAFEVKKGTTEIEIKLR